MSKLKVFITVVLFVIYSSLLFPSVQAADDQVIPDLQPHALLTQAQNTAEMSGLPMPAGALDGAKQTDAMYQVFKLIFGQPLANISQMTSSGDPSGNSNPVTDVNVVVYMFSLMAGIGLLGTLIAAVYTVLEGLVSVSTSAKFLNGGGGGGSPFAFLVSRTGISSLINIPLPFAGGMCLSQVIMIFMALMGIGLGSALFSAVSSKLINQPMITYTSENTEQFFISTSQAILCLNYLEKNKFISPTDARIYLGGAERRSDGVNAGHVTKHILFGSRGQCGRFNYTFRTSMPPSADSRTGFSRWIRDVFSSSGDNVIDEIDDYFRPAAFEAVFALLTNPDFTSSIGFFMEDTYDADGYTPKAENTRKFAASYATYKSNLRAIFAELDNKLNRCIRRTSDFTGRSSDSNSSTSCSNETIRELISKQGFMLAGTYSYILNQRQSVLSNTLETAVPKFEFDHEDMLSRYNIDDSPELLNELENRFGMLSTTFKSIATESTGTMASDLNRLYEATTSDNGVSQLLGDILYSSMRGIVKIGYAGQESSFQNPEPITQLSQLGNVMMAIPFAIVLGQKAVSMMISSTPALGVASKLLSAKSKLSKYAPSEDGLMSKVFSIMLASAMQAIVVGGFFLAVFVPAIPYVMWNMAIFGYISYVILCVIAVPIMVAAKPLKDGDGFIGGVKTGYMMAFTVFMRPAAMIIGLFTAMVLSRIFSWIINATYFESIQIAYSNGFNLGAVFGVPLMYALIQLTAIYKAYSMINEVPAFIGKMTETDRAHTDFGEEGERNRIGGVFIQGGNHASGSLRQTRGKPSKPGAGAGAE